MTTKRPTAAARERREVAGPLVATSAVAWMLLAVRPGSLVHLPFCGLTLGLASTRAEFRLLLALHPPAALVGNWLLMVAAMMTPLLSTPVWHVLARSLPSHRARCVALLLAGYVSCWLVAGAALVPLALALRLMLAPPWPLVAGLAIAFVWQVSPAKQRCLNRCHALPTLSAFGGAADLAGLRLGLGTGLWCVGACAPTMLLALLVMRWHFAAMALAALWLAAERLERPAVPRWRWRWPKKVSRILVARLRAQNCTLQPSS